MYLLSYLDIHVYIAYTNKRKKKRRDRENETERCVSNMLYCIYLCLLVSWIFHLSLNIKKSQKGSMPWRLSRRNPIPNAPSCSSSSLLWYRGDRWEPLVNKKRQICWWNADDSDDSTKYRCRWQFLIAVLEGNLLEILQLAVWDVRTSQISWSESDQSTLSFEVPSYSLL